MSHRHALFAVVGLVSVIACAPTPSSTQPSFSERQRRALDDPYGYGGFDKSDKTYNIDSDDPKDLNRDINHVFNP